MHRKICRRFDTPGEAHYVTFSCHQRKPLLRSPVLCQWLADAIEEARTTMEFDLWAFVFMPEHVHLVVMSRRQDYSISALISAIKRPVAYRAIGHLKQTEHPLLTELRDGSRRGADRYRLWLPGGGYDRNLQNAEAVHAAIEYAHHNPVRRGLTATAVEWLWSSARAWQEGTDEPIRMDRSVPMLVP
jgi:putative transposase